MCVMVKKTYLIFWSGQTWSPGPTQKYLVSVNQGSPYVIERAKNSADRKWTNFQADSLNLLSFFLVKRVSKSSLACSFPKISLLANFCQAQAFGLNNNDDLQNKM